MFIQQATNRRVEYTATQKLRVESKEAIRNRGVSSPDRADAVFAAMVCDWRRRRNHSGDTEMDQVWQLACPIL